MNAISQVQANDPPSSSDIPILRTYCLILAKIVVRNPRRCETRYAVEEELDTITAQNTGGRPLFVCDHQRQLQAELVHKVAFFTGNAESQGTEITGLSLFRHTLPTAPALVNYEPSVALVVQGSKQVELGANTFLYDPSKYLLTSLDLPVVSRVIEASLERPYLCLRLKLEIPTIREILSREDVALATVNSDALAMSTAEISVQLLSAFARLLDLLNAPEDIPFLGPMIKREIIYRILGELCENDQSGGSRAHCRDEHVHFASSFSPPDFHESAAIPEAASFAGCSTTHACGRS